MARSQFQPKSASTAESIIMRSPVVAILLGCFTTLHAPSLWAQQRTMTELVPQSASHAVMFRHVEELKQRGDEVSTELGFNFGVSSLFSMIGSQLHVTGSADDYRPCGIMWFEPELIGEPDVRQAWKKPVAAAVAIADANKLADALKVDHDSFQAGMIVKREHSAFGHRSRFYRMVDQYLWVVSHEKLYDVLDAARPLAQKIPRSQLKGIDSADFLIEVSARSGELNHEMNQERAEKWIEAQQDLDAAEAEAIREWFSILYSASYAIFTGTVDRGCALSLQVLFDHDASPELRQKILKFSPPGQGVSLKALPDGELLFGHAARTDSVGIHAALTAVIRKGHGLWWPPVRKMRDQKIISQLEQLKLLGLFGEIWPLTERYKAGIYREQNAAGHGLISMAAILTTDSSDQLVHELKMLASLVDRTAFNTGSSAENAGKTETLVRELIEQLGDDNFQKRRSATTRLVLIGEPALPLIREARQSTLPEVAAGASQIEKLILEALNEKRRAALASSVLGRAKPVFIFHPNAEQRAGASVDVMEVRVDERSELKQLMPVLAGPEWSRIRLVKSDRHVAVFFGSNLTRFEQLIANIGLMERGGDVGVPETPYGKPMLEMRGAEFQGSFARVIRLLDGLLPTTEDPDTLSDPELSSIGVTIEPDFLAVEWRASLPDMKALRKKAF